MPDACDVDVALEEGANLISLYALGDDSSVSGVFDGLGDAAIGVIGESVVSGYFDGTWIGSLQEVSLEDGYWVKVNADATLDVDGTPSSEQWNLLYSLNEGNNLISYPYDVGQDLDGIDATGLLGLSGEGVAAINIGGTWYGSLNGFEGGSGYWFVTTGDMDFNYNEPSSDALSREIAHNTLPQVPVEYAYTQSTRQSFFFVEDITIDGQGLDNNDWIIAYNGDVVVGARQWSGSYTDIPAMGHDNNTATAGYGDSGDNITFKVYDVSEDRMVDVSVTDGSTSWINNGLTVISMSDSVLPTEVTLGSAYPNPFNPSTSFMYDISSDMNVSIAIYDIKGRMITELVNGIHGQGQYQATWNADINASGVYFVQMVAGSTVKTQKLMLVK